jgi:ArsR family transcriptional regulator, arsenate/arsenite/antimonite-responsive transcriptional repressor
MNLDTAIIALSALSQETRLRVFKLLIEYGQNGISAGSLSGQLQIPHNTLSFHLSHLSHAGLVTSRKQGRQIIYAANCEAMEGLLGYLRENCCIREEDQSACATECGTDAKERNKQ